MSLPYLNTNNILLFYIFLFIYLFSHLAFEWMNEWMKHLYI